MLWTKELADRLLMYYEEGHSWVEISRAVGLEPQSVARLARGMHKSVGDESGQRILAMLGVDKEPVASYKPRALIAVHASMVGMEPTIRKGQDIYCEPVQLAHCTEGEPVFIKARALVDGSWQDIETIGYLDRQGQAYSLSQEQNDVEVKLNPRDIEYVAAVVLPMSRHFAVDIRTK